MPKKTTPTVKNLETLGARRLAELLVELCDSDATAKRRLRLALASAAGPKEVARQIRNRIRTISRSTSFVDWSQARTLARDLETQRRMIVGDLAGTDALLALDLLWDFMALATPVFERCDDSNGTKH